MILGRLGRNGRLFRLSKVREKVATYHEGIGLRLEHMEMGSELGLSEKNRSQRRYYLVKGHDLALDQTVNVRLPDRSRRLNVQMQLIALWHKSLHQSGRARGSAL